MRKVLLIGFVLLMAAESFSQSFYAIRRERGLIVNAGSGTASYKGELVNPNTLGKIRYNIVAGLEHYITNRIAARAELTYFRISGSDNIANDDRRERNLSFFSSNLELSAVGIVHLLKNGDRYYRRPIFNIYGYTGIGLLYMNPKTEYNGERYALQPVQTEGASYSRFQPVIPYGFGGKVKLSPFFNVALEGGYRITFTDYMDDISIERYPNPTTLDSDLARALSDRRREIDPDYPVGPNVGKRGNPKNNDGYLFFNVKVQYYLPVDFLAKNSGGGYYNKKRRSNSRRR